VRPQPRCGWMGRGQGTQGRPRSSANPGLEDATPLALGASGTERTNLECRGLTPLPYTSAPQRGAR
jgi:hypothetical protein